MKVTLIDYTGMGFPYPATRAEDILLSAKNTRLLRSPNEDWITALTAAERKEQLAAIARTIPSSWEFLHYTFLIEGVSRAFTHQLVRTRTASYAQQAMRVVDMGGFDYLTPEDLPGGWPAKVYHDTMALVANNYSNMIKNGSPAQAARGILPTNILTNIMMSANLRTVVETARKRSSGRVQGEYREFVEKMQGAVEAIHPFTADFFGLEFKTLRRELDAELFYATPEARDRILKLFDKMVETLI